MLLDYARVSTDDQDLALQRAALKQAGCRRLYEEKLSGARRDRPQLARLLDQAREGDVVVVSRLDRLARSTATCSRSPSGCARPAPGCGPWTSPGPTPPARPGGWC
jgi:DNA invertase Pin-like site-specific DNA recombinase